MAIEQDIPFVCIPFGTPEPLRPRHRPRPRRSARRTGGVRRRRAARSMSGAAGDRLFLNNVSLGSTPCSCTGASTTGRRREALARLRAARTDREGPSPPAALTIDGEARAARDSSSSRTTPQPRPRSRSANVTGSTRVSSTSTSRTASGASPGRNAAAPSLEIGSPSAAAQRRRRWRADGAGAPTRVPDRAGRVYACSLPRAPE